jgi:hypothetical protein
VFTGASASAIKKKSFGECRNSIMRDDYSLLRSKWKEPEMQYHCLIYFDPKVVFAATAEAEAMNAAIGPHTAQMTAKGQLVAAFPLNMPQEAITVQMRNGKMSTTDGPFMETREMLGGLVVIEARDLNEAVQIAAGLPHAQLGHVEVRPAIDYSQPRPQL